MLTKKEILARVEEAKKEKEQLLQNTLLALDSIKGFVDSSDIDQLVKRAWRNKLKSEVGVYFEPQSGGNYVRTYGTYELFKESMLAYSIGGLNHTFAKTHRLGSILQNFQNSMGDWKTLKSGVNKLKVSFNKVEDVYRYFCKKTGIDFNYEQYKKDTLIQAGYSWVTKNEFTIGEWDVKRLTSQNAIEIKGIEANDIFEMVYMELANELAGQIAHQQKNQEYATPTWLLNSSLERWERANFPFLNEFKTYMVARFEQDGAILEI